METTFRCIKINLSIFLVFFALVLSGCAASTLHVYPGEKNSGDKISIIHSAYTGSILLSAARDAITPGVCNETRFYKVDDQECDGFTAVAVLPGPHVLKVKMKRSWSVPLGATVGGAVESLSSSFAEVDMAFTSEAGRNYYVDGKIVNGNPVAWITEEKTGNIVAGRKE